MFLPGGNIPRPPHHGHVHAVAEELAGEAVGPGIGSPEELPGPAHVVDLEVPEEGVAVVADPVQELPDTEARLRCAALQLGTYSRILYIRY